MWIRIWSYSWGKIFYLILAILVVIGLDLLIAMNKYDLFFMILGVEIIIGIIATFMASCGSSTSSKSQSDSQSQTQTQSDLQLPSFDYETD